LDGIGRKWWKAGENCIMRNFINLYTSPNIVRVIKSRSMRWAGHVAPMGVMRNAHSFLVEKTERKRPLERLGVHGRIILEWILGK
jgi:hypothetical protein